MVRIGHVERRVIAAQGPHHRYKIPTGYLAAVQSDAVSLRHLQWMMQKDALQQDWMLVGSDGGDGAMYRRHLLLAYAELIQRPVEIVTLSHHTTESDLKQRRILKASHGSSVQQQQQLHNHSKLTSSLSSSSSSGTTDAANAFAGGSSGAGGGVFFQDQGPVRAAMYGHLLLLDGIHCVERNVLPTLNNLLENRELPLEDGRCMISSSRYQQLTMLPQHQRQTSFLVPVHTDFRVMATMTIQNNSNSNNNLDPPVRSRFQIRRIDPVSTDILYQRLESSFVQQLQLELQPSMVADDNGGGSAADATPHINDSAAQRELVLLATAMSNNAASTTTTVGGGTSSSTQQQQHLHWSAIQALPALFWLRQHFSHSPMSLWLERTYPYMTSEPRLRAALDQSWPAAKLAAQTMHRICHELSITTTTNPSTASSINTKRRENVGKRNRKEESVDSDVGLPYYDVKGIETIPDDTRQVKIHFQWMGQPSLSSDDERTKGFFESMLPSMPNSHPTKSNSSFDAVTVLACSGGLTPQNHQPWLDPSSSSTSEGNDSTPIVVSTVGSRHVITAMLQDHGAGRDVLLVSPKGEGKNAMTRVFCDLLGYQLHLFPLYKEMTAHDLLWRRRSSSSSSTTTTTTLQQDWEESPLLKAARLGQVCVLDGIEKLSRDTLATLQGFLCDREVHLPDGTKYRQRISAEDDFSSMMVRPIHPSFRVIALASIASSMSGNTPRSSTPPPTWLSEEATSMFSTIALPEPSRQCLRNIILGMAPNNNRNCSWIDDDLDRLLLFHERLQESAEDCGVAPLSIRTLLRLAKQRQQQGTSSEAPHSSLYESLCSCLLVDLLAPTQRATLETVMKSCGIVPTTNSGLLRKSKGGPKEEADRTSALVVAMDDQVLRMGDWTMPRRVSNHPELVPSPYFFDIPSHVQLIQRLVSEWWGGERAFLLLGNQGTGKNKICDRLCQLANFEREYIQLHRDSTIGQLTISPSLEDGRIVWKDSPLVRAVTFGRALVIDEADKAPPEVVAVLKSLVEDGELLLADGRRILRSPTSGDDDCIAMHPDFTVWVLANRPGRLFHGNHFEIMDCFSSHVVPNPDLESEVRLLQSYAPSIDEKLLRRISASFDQLRRLFERGDISYPYSTREAVAVAKHLESYPNDDVVEVLHNVLDFDSYNDHMYLTIGEVFRTHGFPFQSYSTWKRALQESQGRTTLQIEYSGDRSEGSSSSPPPLSSPKIGKWDEKNEAHVGGNQWQGGTGGSDTAGLGGRGGPYRLDRGHKVHQVSDESKAEVSEEAKQIARKIAQQALADRLSEIGMSESEHETYTEFLEPINGYISNLRAALDAVNYKSNERSWIKGQLDGELDDARLVEGLAGEKNIYKRRGLVESNQNSWKRKKRLRFVVDCSGSMYRFNGYDQRLTRCLQVTALIMSCFDGLEDKFDYSIVGHSGDSACIELVRFGQPPANTKERLRILQTMVAHSQFCQSGDNTLGAIQQAVVDVHQHEFSHENGDNDSGSGSSPVVIAISDANLERYGISPRELNRAMQSKRGMAGDDAKVFCIFIASFGDEAEAIKRALPIGRAFVCMDSTELPAIVRNILTVEIA